MKKLPFLLVLASLSVTAQASDMSGMFRGYTAQSDSIICRSIAAGLEYLQVMQDDVKEANAQGLTVPNIPLKRVEKWEAEHPGECVNLPEGAQFDLAQFNVLKGGRGEWIATLLVAQSTQFRAGEAWVTNSYLAPMIGLYAAKGE